MEIEEWKEKVPDLYIKNFSRVLLVLLVKIVRLINIFIEFCSHAVHVWKFFICLGVSWFGKVMAWILSSKMGKKIYTPLFSPAPIPHNPLKSANYQTKPQPVYHF